MMISKLYNFLVFVIYMRNINDIDPPKVKTAWGIASLQMLLFLLVIFMIAIFGDFSLRNIKALLLLIVLAIFIFNYRLCVKQNYLDRIKERFENSEMDTEKNKKIAMASVVLFFCFFILSIFFLSYFKFEIYNGLWNNT